MQRILIVEDDTNINNLLREALSKAGYSCEQAFSGTEAKLLLNMPEHNYSLVLLDLMLPGITGEEVLAGIRKKGKLPVIVLTAKDGLDEKVQVLTNGADDYIAKPFAIEEVLARIRVALRHTTINKKENDENILTLKNLTVDLQKHSVKYKNEEIELTKREFELLVYLLQNKNIVITRNQILNQVWGYDYIGETNVVDVYIRYLRTKIDDKFGVKLIHTIRGVGYFAKDE